MSEDSKHNQSASEMFEQRIADQIRESIGDLVPEEMLRDKVSKVIDGVFFNQSVDYRGNIKYAPTHAMSTLVHSIIDKRVETILEPVMASLGEHMENIIKDRIRSGFVSAIISDLDAAISGKMFQSVENLKTDLRDKGIDVY